MLFYIIPISLFIVGMVIFAVLQKDNFLEKLQWLPGEKILFEDSHCRFESKNSQGRGSYYPMGHVCVTNERIILAQRGLFGKKRTLRFILPYGRMQDPQENAGYLKNALKTGHITFRTHPTRIGFGEKKGKSVITFQPLQEATSIFEVAEVKLYPSNVELYKKVFA